MNEIVPILLGLVSGLFVASRRVGRSTRLAALAGLSVVLGAAATVVTGEALISWGFLFVDIPLVFGTGLAAMVVSTLGLRAVRGN